MLLFKLQNYTALVFFPRKNWRNKHNNPDYLTRDAVFLVDYLR